MADANLEAALSASIQSAADNEARRIKNKANLNHVIKESLSDARKEYGEKVEQQKLYYAKLYESLEKADIEPSILETISDEYWKWGAFANQLKEYHGKRANNERIRPHFVKLIESIDKEFSKTKESFRPGGVAPRALLEGDRDPSQVVIIDDGGAGDCLYYALIGALGDKGISPPEFGNPITVASLRIYVNRNIDHILSNTYDHLKQLSRDNQLIVVSQSFNAWQIEAYINALNKPDFIRRFKEGVLIAGNWACQLEVDFFKEKLAGLGYELRVLTRPFGELPKTNSNGRPIIHLYNPNNVHFQHFRYINAVEPRPVRFASPAVLPTRLPVGSVSPAVLSPKLPARSPVLSPKLPAPSPVLPSKLPAPKTMLKYSDAAAAARGSRGGTRRKINRTKKSRKH